MLGPIMANLERERVAVIVKEEKNARQQQSNTSKDTEKIAFNAGPSYDFWNSEGDSIYDELYGDDV